MRVLSLFDGMSCGQIALDRLGLNYSTYFASEIDKYAIQVTQTNYPKTIQVGNVVSLQGKDVPEIDLLIGGSPCQGFSRIGNRLNFKHDKSKLFFEFVRLMHECKPRFFLLENVMMKKEWVNVISDHLMTDPVRINSNLIVPINRDRLYWTNIPLSPLKDTKPDIRNYLKKGEVSATVGSSKNRIFRQTKFFGALTSSMYKGVRASGRPLICVESAIGKHIDDAVKDVEYRMLFPYECERLQTVPLGYTSCVSNTQRYKMLGNGWTVDVIAHILKGVTTDK